MAFSCEWSSDNLFGKATENTIPVAKKVSSKYSLTHLLARAEISAMKHV